MKGTNPSDQNQDLNLDQTTDPITDLTQDQICQGRTNRVSDQLSLIRENQSTLVLSPVIDRVLVKVSSQGMEIDQDIYQTENQGRVQGNRLSRAIEKGDRVSYSSIYGFMIIQGYKEWVC